jgi:guanylate kinase
MAELQARLEGRGTEDAAERERRLARAHEEMSAAEEFDHVIVNDDVDAVVTTLLDLIPDPGSD